MPSQTTRWGDADDDSDEENNIQHHVVGQKQAAAIPPTQRSAIDNQGIQIVTSYKPGHTPGQLLIKTTTKKHVDRFTMKEPKDVQMRRSWKKFGQALLDEKDGKKTTVQSKEEVLIENPHTDMDLQDEDPAAAISASLNDFWAKRRRRALAHKYNVNTNDQGEGGSGGWMQVCAASTASSTTGGPNRYVPPSQRGTAAPGGGAYKPPMGRGVATAGSTMEDLNTIRVTNLSGRTTEADLQELFSHFGRVSRVHLAKNKETLESRGFAFVTFFNQKDAAVAMEKLQGYGYDHLILKLDWAQPNQPKNPAISGSEYRSGYGKALAQDTKEKVLFSSNLTK